VTAPIFRTHVQTFDEVRQALQQLWRQMADGAAAPHTVLSAGNHTDTLTGTVVDGDVIIGNATPKWARLAITVPAANIRNVLGVDNGELRPSWKAALDATTPATIAVGGAGTAGTSLIFSHRDHNHPAPATWTATAHDLFSAIHGDTTGAASPVDGDIIIGNATPKWSKLAITVPAANVLNVLAVANGELRPSWKALFDGTNPTTIGIGDAAAPGTSLLAAHRDHQHASPSTWTATAHNVLSAIHGDSTAASCVRGDIITGQGTPTAKWTRLAISVPAATYLNVLGAVNGDTEPGYKELFDAALPEVIIEGSAGALGTDVHVARRDHAHPAPSTWAATAHAILDSTYHSDATTGTCTRGDIITAQGATPKWVRLAITVPAATFMDYIGTANGDTEPGYKALFDATVPTTIAESAVAAAGTAAVAARRDHTHGAPATWAATAHNVLSAIHGDALADSVLAGDLMHGNATPKWARLAAGSQYAMLQMGASLPAWTLTPDGLTSIAATTGKFDHVAEQTGAHTVTFDNNITAASGVRYVAPVLTTNSQIQAGSFEIQGYSATDGWFGQNVYFDGANFVHRAASYSSLLRFTSSASWNYFRILDGDTGIAGSAVTLIERMIVGGLPTLEATYSALWMHRGFTAQAVSNYSLLGDGSNLFVNAPNGGTLYFRINNGTVGQFAGSVFSVDHIAELTGAHNVVVDNLLSAAAGAKLGDGGATNYAAFAADGELTLAGTARVTKTLVLSNADLGKGTTAPAEVALGNYTGWEFDLNDDAIMTTALPKDWASGTDIEIEVCWYVNEAYALQSAEVKWQVAWSMTPHDGTEALDAPTHTGTDNSGDVNINATAKTLLETTVETIPAASIAVGDEIGLTVKRIALTGGTDPTAKPTIIHVYINYTADKLGAAT